MTESKQYMQGLDEYIRQGEPQEQERGRAWQTAIRLQEVDGLNQSANFALSQPSKCKNCTLEGIAVFRIIHQEPTATQKHIASEIGKSERTVKSITARLQEQGILIRKNGKRNGYREITN